MAKNEPQSYGSEKEWLTGETGQTVNRLEGHPDAQHADFYASRHDDSPADGGTVSPDSSESPAGRAEGAHEPVQKVTAKERGAKRESYWKDRDYKQ